MAAAHHHQLLPSTPKHALVLILEHKPLHDKQIFLIDILSILGFCVLKAIISYYVWSKSCKLNVY